MEIYEPTEPWPALGRYLTWKKGDTPAGPNYIEERDIRDVETLHPHRCPVCAGAGVIWREDTR